jgi:hypothetical protein
LDGLAVKRRPRFGLVGVLLVALAACGCGEQAAVSAAPMPPESARRAVAGQFATALLTADGPRARALLVDPDEDALVFLVRRAVAHWRQRHVSIRLPARRVGTRWMVRYAGKRTFRDGRFEIERGELVVLVGRSTTGRPRVRFFAFAQVDRRFSTHQDAELLPSKR